MSTSTQRSRKHRSKNVSSPRKRALTNTERQRNYRERSRSIIDNHDHHERSEPKVVRNASMQTAWKLATDRFTKYFINNLLGFACDICDRIWFCNDLKPIRPSHLPILIPEFGASAESFKACSSCYQTLQRQRLPKMSTTNGFRYVPKPDLPLINPIELKFISPRLAFIQIRRLRRDGAYGVIGQAINVPVNVNTMVQLLPRQLDDDAVINVAIKRKTIHKSTFLEGHVRKGVIRAWLKFFETTPLYRKHEISIDWQTLGGASGDQLMEIEICDQDYVEELDSRERAIEPLLARQHTMLWNEEHVLTIAPGQNSRPLNPLLDPDVEELTFPQIYYGCTREYKIPVTPFMRATSEIRRSDRRGATPEHILWLACYIMSYQIHQSIYSSFRCSGDTAKITREMIEDKNFINSCLDKDFAYLKSIPNSAQYWMSRKLDLFAMMKQLGKPTVFLTISANETNWPHLISVLHKLSDYRKDLDVTNLDKSIRSHLVNEDPITCCIYFKKLLDVLLQMICSKSKYNPFWKYRVRDYFKRIEFQHRGSAHAHIILWLDEDPKEPVSEDMKSTIQLVTDLCSVSESDLPPNMYSNQVHKHTFTCTKNGSKTCRFNIPYWPMKETKVLKPLASDDKRLETLKERSKNLRARLEEKVYDSIDTFLSDNNLNEESYFNIIRSSLKRPTLFFERNMKQIWTNTFNPWIASILNSNMDLQFILDEYSCARYVVDYINKSQRGLGDLHQKLIEFADKFPEMTREQLHTKIGSTMLNSIEMCSQEAAWYLLRLSMSFCSRMVIFIPTMHPNERRKSHKKKSQMDKENLPKESTDIWTKSIFQKYEERPIELESICLADFAAWYTQSKSEAKGNDDTEENRNNIDQDQDGNEPDIFPIGKSKYYKRKYSRVIRYCNFKMEDIKNYKREHVTLFVPFRIELRDILDRDKYLDIYNDKLDIIKAKKQEYDSGINMERIEEEMRQSMEVEDNSQMIEQNRETSNRETNRDRLEENLNNSHLDINRISKINKKDNLLSREDYCSQMRCTNKEQRTILLEIIHRLNSPETAPIQVFFTGPAGSGKTFVLNLMKDIYNRYSPNQNSFSNAFLACASTGKAAVNLGGTTVHSAFHLSQASAVGQISQETLNRMRLDFANVKCVIIDEVSMLSYNILSQVDHRLKQITGNLNEYFGGLHIIVCGDFRQLPPVKALSVYRGSKNHIEGALLWQSLDHFKLTRVMRQKDKIFSDILLKVGMGHPLNDAEVDPLQARFRSTEWCATNVPDAPRLFFTNNEVDQYNAKVIKDGMEHAAKDKITGYRTFDELRRATTTLHKMKTAETKGLPYLISLKIGIRYMITTNINVEDRLVNGATGILCLIETLPQKEEVANERPRLRLWMDFGDRITGSSARLEVRSTIQGSNGTINSRWTPINLMKKTIDKFGGSIKCQREQFPLSAACAMTIHKSQGATFDSIVFEYDKNKLCATSGNQLVYVALSRVTSLEGLFLTNSKNDFTFHHKHGDESEATRGARAEYARLEQHPLPTLTHEVESFCRADEGKSNAILLCTINAQSLVAHARDIDSDELIMRSDLLAITETWMNESDPVSIRGFELIASCSSSSSSSQETHSRRIAGGVAIYRRIESTERPKIWNDSQYSYHNAIVDICSSQILISERYKFILISVYFHPGVSKSDMQTQMSTLLADLNTRQISSQGELPVFITGDFNNDVNSDSWLIDFMREFEYQYVQNQKPTNLGISIIDLTFVKNLEATCIPYVAYFSYHRPIFNKIFL